MRLLPFLLVIGAVGCASDPCQQCSDIAQAAWDDACAEYPDCVTCQEDATSDAEVECDGELKESAKAALDAETCDADIAELISLACGT